MCKKDKRYTSLRSQSFKFVETKNMPIPRQNVYVFIQWLANLPRNKLWLEVWNSSGNLRSEYLAYSTKILCWRFWWKISLILNRTNNSTLPVMVIDASKNFQRLWVAYSNQFNENQIILLSVRAVS